MTVPTDSEEAEWTTEESDAYRKWMFSGPDGDPGEVYEIQERAWIGGYRAARRGGNSPELATPTPAMDAAWEQFRSDHPDGYPAPYNDWRRGWTDALAAQPREVEVTDDTSCPVCQGVGGYWAERWEPCSACNGTGGQQGAEQC